MLQQINNVQARALVGRLGKTSRQSAAGKLFVILDDLEARILVKTLAFKLEVVAKALVGMLCNTPADAEATTLQDTPAAV